MGRASASVLAFDFGGTKCEVGLVDRTGTVVALERIPTAAYAEADELVGALLAAADRLSGSGSALAVGVASMGLTREDDVLMAPNVPGWSRLRLPAMFRRRWPDRPVVVVNDVKAALMAESRWGALANVTYGAYVNLGSGVAVAFAQDGRLWSGAHGAAGELAYAWRPGETGWRHGHAPLEERLGGLALDRRLRAAGFGSNLAEAFARSREDVAVQSWLKEAFLELGWWIGQALLLLDVERVAVGGGAAAQLSVFGPWWETVWRDYLPFVPELVPARLGSHAALVGAGAAAWDMVSL
jgi:glucokinase